MAVVLALIGVLLLLSGVSRSEPSPPKLQYTALSDAAKLAGTLNRYNGTPQRSGSLQLDEHRLTWSVPRKVRAYDLAPIQVQLDQAAGERIAVEAVGFEDPRRTKGIPLHDMAIPGSMQVKIEYLGSLAADLDHESYIPYSPDPYATPNARINLKRDRKVRSGAVRQAEAMWFHFKVTNTGDTILDPEGFGASFGYAWIEKLRDDGTVEWRANTVNQYERCRRYVYPGESFDHWVNFFCPQLGGKYNRGLTEGRYRVHFSLLYRYHDTYNWGLNIWHGAEYARLTVPITVKNKPEQTPVTSSFTQPEPSVHLPGYIDRFEEFMTSFRVYPAAGSPARHKETLYLQVAPWTTHITLKLVQAPGKIRTVAIPIEIDQSSLVIAPNPRNNMVITHPDGREEAAFVAQAMPGMRLGFQLGPWPERHMRAEARRMKQVGINVIVNTAGGWHTGELTGRKTAEMHSMCYRYWYDVIVREMGFKLMGWSVYPPSGPGWYSTAEPLLGRPLSPSMATSTYGGHAGVDMGDPAVPEMIAIWAIHQYRRWGDLWFQTRDGRIFVDIEDSWGWLRDDINVRYTSGPLACARFRDWLKTQYGSLTAVNTAWGTDYKDWSDILPEENHGVEGDGMTHGPVWNNKDNPFHDWSKPTEDWDRFRTHLRNEIYRQANTRMQRVIPGAELSLRCEGANMVVRSSPDATAWHDRHVYYSQRRNAMVFDEWIRDDVIHCYSDYTTLPYTEAEWRRMVREMSEHGIVAACLPQFDHMRDIVPVPDGMNIGREYQMHYNLAEPRRGVMIHCLMAAYPWFKATWEEGGAPGIILHDFLCDGFATDTQYREIELFTRNAAKRNAFRND